MAAGEQDVGGVHDAVGRDHHDRVPTRVRGPDLDQPHLLRAHAQRELAVERLGWEGELDVIELERPEDAAQELTQEAHLRRLPQYGRQQSRGTSCISLAVAREATIRAPSRSWFPKAWSPLA